MFKKNDRIIWDSGGGSKESTEALMQLFNARQKPIIFTVDCGRPELISKIGRKNFDIIMENCNKIKF